MDLEMIYWLASTVAQSVVALLAFGAFVAISRRDALWNSVKDTLDKLTEQCRQMDGERRYARVDFLITPAVMRERIG